MDLYTLVTNIGKAKIANATVLGKKVDFSKLKVGDGNGNYYEPSESQTNLVHKVWEGNVNNVLTGGEKNPNWIVVQTMIPPGEGGFYIRECGLFDEEDNLLAISKYPESYKPTMDEGSTDDLTIELIFEVSNAATINLKIDPLVTLASLQNLYDLESKINKKIETLSTRLNDLTSDSYPIVEATGTNAYIGASARIKAVGKGTRCTLFVGTASNGNCSLNLNNSGAAAIKDSNGNVVTNMKANIPYNLCHNGSDFILQGKGGGGNLIPKYLLAGYYGEGDNGRVDGAMVNRGAPTSNLNCGGVVNLQEGYYAGGQIIANSLASQTGGATADDTKVLNGYTYWRDGALRTGNASLQSMGGARITQGNLSTSVGIARRITIPSAGYIPNMMVIATSLEGETTNVRTRMTLICYNSNEVYSNYLFNGLTPENCFISGYNAYGFSINMLSEKKYVIANCVFNGDGSVTVTFGTGSAVASDRNLLVRYVLIG